MIGGVETEGGAARSAGWGWVRIGFGLGSIQFTTNSQVIQHEFSLIKTNLHELLKRGGGLITKAHEFVTNSHQCLDL